MGSQHFAKEPDPHLSVLRLLTSPLRLICATVCRVVQENDVLNYGVVEEFIASVAETIPDLLTERQWVQLLLGLRAKMVLESCRFENSAGPKTTQDYLDRMQLPTPPSIRGSDMEASQSSFLELLKILLNDADWKDVFFQEVFPEYGPKIDLQLQRLISTFVSRLEEFLPTSCIEQVAAMLGEVPSVMEECFQTLSHPHKLLSSVNHLKSHADIDTREDHIYGRPPPAEPPEDDDCIFSFLSQPPLVQVVASGEGIKAGLSSSLCEDVLIECEEVSGLANDVYIVEAKCETKMREDMVKIGGHQDGGVNRHIAQQQKLVCGNTTIAVPRQLIVKLDRIDVTGIPLPTPLPRQSGRPRTKRLSFLQAKNIWQQIAPIDDDESDPDFTSDLVTQHSDAFAKRGITEGCKPPPVVIFACSKCSFQANTGIDLDQHLVKDHPNDFQQLHSASYQHRSLSELKPNHVSFASVKQAVPERSGVLKTCPVCKKSFARGSIMRKHLKEKHSEVGEAIFSLQSNVEYLRGLVSKTCPVCNKTFSRGCVMREHLKKQHSAVRKEILSPQPNRDNLSRAEILPPLPTQDHLSVDNDTAATASHNDQVSRELESSPEQRSIPELQPNHEACASEFTQHFQPPEIEMMSNTCPKCGKTFLNPGNARRHLKTHTACSSVKFKPPTREVVPITCPVCEMTFVQDHVLTKHLKTWHSEVCDEILSSLAIQDNLREVVMSKTCPKCKKTFPQVYLMRRHLQHKHFVVCERILSPLPNQDSLSLENNAKGTIAASSVELQLNLAACGSVQQVQPSGSDKTECMAVNLGPKKDLCGKEMDKHPADFQHPKALELECAMEHSTSGNTSIHQPNQNERFSLLSELEKHNQNACKEPTAVIHEVVSPTDVTQGVMTHAVLAPKWILKCDGCKEVFHTVREMQKHEFCHWEGKPLRCSHCGQHFKEAITLNSHSQVPSQCTMCEGTFTDLASLSLHYLEAHSITHSYPCSDCQKTFPNVCGLVRHLHDHTGELPFQCTLCLKRFKSPWSLTKHRQMTTCRGNRTFLCHVCGKGFHVLSTLKAHETIHQSTRDYICSDCGKSFRGPHNLKAHMRIHVDDETRRRHLCTVCGKKFPFAAGLERHLRIHTGERPFPCTKCDKTFRSDTELQKHMRYHTNYRPFQCEVCKKRFTQTSCLTSHMRVHTGERPYACSVCDKRFALHFQRKRHMLIHTGEKPFVCQRCGRAYNQRNCLTLHLKKCPRIIL